MLEVRVLKSQVLDNNHTFIDSFFRYPILIIVKQLQTVILGLHFTTFMQHY